MTKQNISVVLVDDHDLVREGTRQYLERADHITVIGEATDGIEGQQVGEGSCITSRLVDMDELKIRPVEARS